MKKNLACSPLMVSISETTLQMHHLCPFYLFKGTNTKNHDENWRGISRLLLPFMFCD